MITQNELSISNESYVKKDFYQIYPEILELVNKITSRWDPESSNESDPGIVLLKVLSFIADKNNYNIDKNVLECFMPSCTQEESMRKLCDMMGYDVEYYKSATVDVSFEYEADLDGGKVVIPQFTTLTSSTDDSIIYTTTEQLELTNTTEAKSVLAIEGQNIPLSIGEDNIVRIFNLDDNNRLYLPEALIAENGIFVSSVDKKVPWQQVKNLYTQVAGSRVFKFGYDSAKKLPYLQFPNDIGALLGDGLVISYIRTKGESGNISARVLNKLSNLSDVKIISSNNEEIELTDETEQDLLIGNLSATISGKDKETIDEAYNNFKKTVGTFDTLVTCRDYANAIYNLITDSTTQIPLVSNCQVSDIRDELNRSFKVVSFNEYGISYEDVQNKNDPITNFDLVIYPYRMITGEYSTETYNRSFRPDLTVQYSVKQDLDLNKTISHNFTYPADTELFTIKNYYKLVAKINTNNKVNSVEEAEILDNIKTALFKNFNAREIDFGEELVYDKLLQVITEADSRIKNVSLDDPILTPVAMYTDGTEAPLTGMTESAQLSGAYADLIIKNILAGRLRMFKYNNLFNYDWGQQAPDGIGESGVALKVLNGNATDEDTPDSIVGLYTELRVDLTHSSFNPGGDSVEEGIELAKNESIIFISPNFVEDYTYPYGVYYRWEPDDSEAIVTKNEVYCLTGSDTLFIAYKDSSGEQLKEVYTASSHKKWKNSTLIISDTGTNIICPSFELIASDDTRSGKIYNFPGYNDKKLFMLQSDEQIQLMKEAKEVLPKTTGEKLPVLWITKSGKIPQGDYILGEGEYFFYSNSTKTILESFGSGTLINWTGAELSTPETASSLDVDNIANYGLNAIANENWVYITKSMGTFTITENKIVSLSEGSILYDITVNSGSRIIDNSFNTAGGGTVTNAYFKYSKDDEGIEQLGNMPGNWKVRSALNLSIGPSTMQTFINGTVTADNGITKKQTAELILKNGNHRAIVQIPSTDTVINCYANYLLQDYSDTSGNIDLRTYIYKDTTKVYTDSVCFYAFKRVPPTLYEGGTISDKSLEIFHQVFYKVPTSIDSVTLPSAISDGYFGLFMVYFVPESTESGIGATVIAGGTGALINHYNSSLAESTDVVSLVPGINILQISKETTSVTIEAAGTDLSGVIFSKLSIVEDTNNGIDLEHLGYDSTNTQAATNILSKIQDIVEDTNGTNIFLYNFESDPTITIDYNTVDPLFWFDKNNIVNKFVLSQLDTDFSGIQLTRASKLK